MQVSTDQINTPPGEEGSGRGLWSTEHLPQWITITRTPVLTNYALIHWENVLSSPQNFSFIIAGGLACSCILCYSVKFRKTMVQDLLGWLGFHRAFCSFSCIFILTLSSKCCWRLLIHTYQTVTTNIKEHIFRKVICKSMYIRSNVHLLIPSVNKLWLYIMW